MKTETASQTTARESFAQHYFDWIEVEWGEAMGTRKYAFGIFEISSGVFTEGLIDRGGFPKVSRSINISIDGGGTFQNDQFTLLNPTKDPNRIEVELADLPPIQGTKVTVKRVYKPDGSTPVPNDAATMAEYRIDKYRFDTGSITFFLVNEIQHVLEEQVLDKIETAEFPTAPPKSQGAFKPRSFGDVEELIAPLVTEGPRSTLDASIDDDDVTLTLSDASPFTNGQATGFVGDEEITWTGKSGNDLTGVTRASNQGQLGESRNWPFGTVVREKIDSYDFIADGENFTVSAAFAALGDSEPCELTKATIGAITGATQANPVVITSTGHGRVAGDKVLIFGVGGTVEINERQFTVANPLTNSFELSGEDGTSHTAYTSGGTWALANSAGWAEQQTTDAAGNEMTLVKLTELPVVELPATSPTDEDLHDDMTWDDAFASANSVNIVDPTRATDSGDDQDTTAAILTGNGAGTAKIALKPNTPTDMAGIIKKATLVVRSLVQGKRDFTNGGILWPTATSGKTGSITFATQALPVLITSNSHARVNGETVLITGIVGMVELNNRSFVIANVTANTFELQGEDGQGHTAYVSDGTWGVDGQPTIVLEGPGLTSLTKTINQPEDDDVLVGESNSRQLHGTFAADGERYGANLGRLAYVSGFQEETEQGSIQWFEFPAFASVNAGDRLNLSEETKGADLGVAGFSAGDGSANQTLTLKFFDDGSIKSNIRGNGIRASAQITPQFHNDISTAGKTITCTVVIGGNTYKDVLVMPEVDISSSDTAQAVQQEQAFECGISVGKFTGTASGGGHSTTRIRDTDANQFKNDFETTDLDGWIVTIRPGKENEEIRKVSSSGSDEINISGSNPFLQEPDDGDEYIVGPRWDQDELLAATIAFGNPYSWDGGDRVPVLDGECFGIASLSANIDADFSLCGETEDMDAVVSSNTIDQEVDISSAVKAVANAEGNSIADWFDGTPRVTIHLRDPVNTMKVLAYRVFYRISIMTPGRRLATERTIELTVSGFNDDTQHVAPSGTASPARTVIEKILTDARLLKRTATGDPLTGDVDGQALIDALADVRLTVDDLRLDFTVDRQITKLELFRRVIRDSGTVSFIEAGAVDFSPSLSMPIEATPVDTIENTERVIGRVQRDLADLTFLINRVICRFDFRGGNNEATATSNDTISQGEIWGIREKELAFHSIKDPTVAQVIADRLITQYAMGVESVKFTVVRRKDNLELGDIVRMVDGDNGLDGCVGRIIGISRPRGLIDLRIGVIPRRTRQWFYSNSGAISSANATTFIDSFGGIRCYFKFVIEGTTEARLYNSGRFVITGGMLNSNFATSNATRTQTDLADEPEGLLAFNPGTGALEFAVLDRTGTPVPIIVMTLGGPNYTTPHELQVGEFLERDYPVPLFTSAASGVITGITNADPAVVTDVGHNLHDGDKILIVGVVGMTEVNGRVFTVANKTDDTFQLQGEDSTAHGVYSSGGTWTLDSQSSAFETDNGGVPAFIDALALTNQEVANVHNISPVGSILALQLSRFSVEKDHSALMLTDRNIDSAQVDPMNGTLLLEGITTNATL